MHEGMAPVVVSGEEIGRGFAAKIAVDALLVHVEFARNVNRPLVRFVCHRCIEVRFQIAMLLRTVASQKSGGASPRCPASDVRRLFRADGVEMRYNRFKA